MQPLQPPDSLHLRAAEGWIGLGNRREANDELEQIAPQFRAHPDVLEIRWLIHAHAKEWHACAYIAGAIIAHDPNRPEAWIHRSYALHELSRTQEAFDNLLPVAGKFAGIWTIPYNLACYCAQLGRLDESKNWFKKAMAIDENAVTRAAAEDPDLKPLWDSLSGTFWKREE